MHHQGGGCFSYDVNVLRTLCTSIHYLLMLVP